MPHDERDQLAPPQLTRAQRRMLRLLGAGYLLEVGRDEVEGEDGEPRFVSRVWLYTPAGEMKRSRSDVVAKLTKAQLLEKFRGTGGDVEYFRLTKTGTERAARLVRRANGRSRAA